MTPFVAIVPVKDAATAKSRLTGLPDVVRRELVHAFALDVVAALALSRAVRHIVVVTDDQALRRALAEAGVTLVPDGGSLNGSILAGAAAAHQWPDTQPLAVLADLPSLSGADLDEVLEAVTEAAYVPDAAGTGTTIYTAPAAAFDPRFGAASAAAHGASARRLDARATLRCDVDDLESLAVARTLGVGVATGQALDRHGL